MGLLADWERYVSPLAASVLPVSPRAFLHVVGVVEIAVGLAVLLGATRLGALVAMAWLVLVALDLIAGGFLDVAVRDLVMAVGAWTLARVATACGEALVPGVAPAHAEAAARG